MYVCMYVCMFLHVKTYPARIIYPPRLPPKRGAISTSCGSGGGNPINQTWLARKSTINGSFMGDAQPLGVSWGQIMSNL